MTLGIPRCIFVRREIETTAGKSARLALIAHDQWHQSAPTSSDYGVQKHSRPYTPDLDVYNVSKWSITSPERSIPETYHGAPAEGPAKKVLL